MCKNLYSHIPLGNINDAIGFVQETKQMNFKESCEYVGSYVGITHIQNDTINMAVL